MPKIVPKSVQTCFEDVLGWFFWKIFLPSVPWKVESSNFFKKNQKSFKNPKMPKNVPKSVQTKIFKIKKISKSQKSPKSFQKVSKTSLGVFFSKKFFAQCSMEGRVVFKKIKKFSKFQKCTNVQTCFEDVLGWLFRKIFCPVFHGGSSLRKFSKKSKKFQSSKNAQNRPQKCPNENFQNQKKIQNSKKAQNRSKKCPNVFWTSLGVIFSRKFFAQCSMEGRVFENFQKNQKSFKVPKMPKIVPKKVQTKMFKIKKKFKIPNMPKIVPKSVQRCFEVVLGWFFRENFLPSVPWRVESSKIFKKIKKVSKFQKCPKSSPKKSKRKFSKSKNFSKFQKSAKSFPKPSKRVLNMFWGDFLEKTFCPVFHGGSSLRKFSKKSKIFQNSKNAQNRPQKCPNENFQNQKKFKIPNMPKIVPKSVQTCFEVVLGWFFRENFLRSVPWRVESSENFKKIKKVSKFQKCPKSSPKVSKRVLKMF